MNREEALSKSESAIKELAQALSQGKSEVLCNYLDAMCKFHQYSFGNCMLIYIQKPDATFVAGFNRWKEFHRWVKKGEKGIAILAPLVRKVKDDGNRRGDDPKEKKVVFGFRTVSVFDVSQTEGKPLPEFASLSGDPGELQMKLENVVTSKGIQLSYVDSLAGANGVSLDGRIEILEGLEPPQKFSTTVHELAHELLHRGDRRELTTKTIRETEAEAVAYAVCRWAGLECSSRASDYIQLYSGDEKVLMQSLEHIRDVSATIIEALESSTVNDCTTELVLTT